MILLLNRKVFAMNLDHRNVGFYAWRTLMTKMFLVKPFFQEKSLPGSPASYE